jgi:hypothetical protein
MKLAVAVIDRALKVRDVMDNGPIRLPHAGFDRSRGPARP